MRMHVEIPSTAQVRSRLLGLPEKGLKEVAQQSGVPFTTLWKIRAGETANPGIETVRKFFPFLGLDTGTSAARSCAASDSAAQGVV